MKRKLVCFLLIIMLFTGCGSKEDEIRDGGKVNYVQAKELIINNGATLVDVRKKEEYDEGHLGGAVSLPVDDIDEDKVKELFDSKDEVIIVYCKSGVRSNNAAEMLKNLGYNNIYDLGAMSNWKE